MEESSNKSLPEETNPQPEVKIQEPFSPLSSLSSSTSSSSLESNKKTSSPDLSLQSPPSSLSSPYSTTTNSSPMKSPPVQTMGQNYDPNRIPTSIFSSKPTTPTEWSTASNESLFSIHMGNNSFSRDHAILFGKSGELPPWLEDWNNPSNVQNSSTEAKGNNCNSNLPLSTLPTVMEVSACEESSVKSGKGERGGNGKNLNEDKKGKMVPASPTASLPRLSDGSGTSTGSSFAFPVLVSDHHSSKPSSLKVVSETHEKPDIQPEIPRPTPKASESRWFCNCSSCWCWPRCC